MKNLVRDIVSFIRSLSFLNLLFFAAVITLIILVVALIYIMRINKEVEEEDEVMNVVNDEELDLANISRSLEENDSKPIELNSYEQEQEERAIISYDELIASQNTNQEVINYKEEKDIEGLKIKSFDLKNLTTTIDLPKVKEENEKTKISNYVKEEEFLEALKRLRKSL